MSACWTSPRSRARSNVLWLVGCYPSYYPRNQLVARAFARLLTQLGVTWGVLGTQEKAMGECDRMFGEEGLFETLVEANRKLLDKQDFRKLVVLDPHAFHALQEYYPRFGAWYPVQHYTTFLADRLEQLKPLDRQAGGGGGHLPRQLLPGPAERVLRPAAVAAWNSCRA